MIKQIIVELKKRNKGVRESYFSDLSKKLMSKDDLRTDYAEKLSIKMPVKEGAVFLANGRQVEKVVLRGSQYIRSLGDGTMQRFDREGHLISIYDKNGNYLKLKWTKTLKQVIDNNGRSLTFRSYPNGKVKQIIGPSQLKVTYRFKDFVNLSQVTNAINETHKYKYDDLHNLIRISFPDGTYKALTYNKKNDWVTSFRDRQGCVEKYVYEDDDRDKYNHYWSKVTKTCGSKVVNRSSYEFWHKKRTDGFGKYLHRVITNNNGKITDVTYHQVFGRPISTKEDGRVVTLSYYKNGLVRTKSDKFQTMKFFYNKNDKVSKVSTKYYDRKGKPLKTKSSSFKYNRKGNLSYAKNSDGQFVKLSYDERGRIKVIQDQAKKIVRIKYETKFGKPSFVERPGLGSINVTYKKNGEVDKVTSAAGPTVAGQVAASFNNLLDIIAPATSELSL